VQWYEVRVSLVRIISGGLVELVGPGMNDGIVVEVVYGGYEALFEFLFGDDADVAQDRAGELGEEALDEVDVTAASRNTRFQAAC
jgi:hypothetical protein